MPEFNRWSRNRRASILAIFPEIWTERKKHGAGGDLKNTVRNCKSTGGGYSMIRN